jgi:hypothetical protein
MALTERTEVDRIEIVGTHKHVQVRTATIIERDGMEVSRAFHRHVITPGADTSGEDAGVQAVCSAVHTPEVIQAYQEHLASSEEV